jgi:gamma-glutamyltranspeptidase/glutathione hydrolase
VKNPKLARTLRRLAAEGPSAIYDGSIAAEIAAAVHSAGGALDLEDLRAYSPRERKPLHASWAGYDIYSMPPPSAGGFLLAETLGLLSRDELSHLGFQSSAYQHLLAEAFRSALADRFSFLGDPDRVAVDVQRLLDPARLARKRKELALDRTHSVPLLVGEEHGTHHLVVVDSKGMVVSLTTTVNRVFGAKLVGAESGVVLNDELDDFTPARDAVALGIEDSPNAPRPNARPVSSMTPTIVLERGRPVLAIGGSGGMAISTNVTQLLVAALTFGKKPDELVRMQRFYVPTSRDTILLEQGGAATLADELRARGERVGMAPSIGFSAVQLISRDASGWLAAADPRKDGSAAVVQLTEVEGSREPCREVRQGAPAQYSAATSSAVSASFKSLASA